MHVPSWPPGIARFFCTTGFSLFVAQASWLYLPGGASTFEKATAPAKDYTDHTRNRREKKPCTVGDACSTKCSLRFYHYGRLGERRLREERAERLAENELDSEAQSSFESSYRRRTQPERAGGGT